MRYKKFIQNLSVYLIATALISLLMVISNLSFFWPENARNHIEFQYTSGIIKIQQSLFYLNSECRRGEFEFAQNTFLDLQQQWQRQDVIFKSMTIKMSSRVNYLPSDSLAILGNYLNQVYESPGNGFDSNQILKEIRRINDKVDRMH